MMSRFARCMVAATLAAAFIAAAPVLAKPGTVEQIITRGMLRMSETSFREAFGIREGDPYDVAQIRAAYRRLWDLKIFSDITIEPTHRVAPDAVSALITATA